MFFGKRVPQAMNKTSSIAVFDSGMGGLTVLSRIIEFLPHENTIYYADSANCPYGPKPQSLVRELVSAAVEKLLTKDIKMVVIACNTASAAAVEYLRATYPIEFVAMEPAIKPAVLSTHTGTVGVIATKGTVESGTVARLKSKWSQAGVVSVAGEGLVELVEHDMEESQQARELVGQYMRKFIREGADKVVLGCTHYPFLRPLMEEALKGSGVEIIDPAPAIARRVKSLLERDGMLNDSDKEGTRIFDSSADEKYNTALEAKLKRYMRLIR